MTWLGHLIKGKERTLTREILKRTPGGKAAAMQKTVLDKDSRETRPPWDATAVLIIDGMLLRNVAKNAFGAVSIAQSVH